MKTVAVTPRVRNSMAVRDAPEPQLGERDALIKVIRVGICGTDMEIKAGEYGTAPLDSDHLIIGHESLGRVSEVGPSVRGIAVGDYVVASVRRPCPHLHCLPCRSGLSDMCVTGDFQERGINFLHGYLAEFYSEDEQRLTRIPPELEPVGVLLEPLSVVEKAISQTFKIQERLPWNVESAFVLGAGAIGLLGAMLLRLKGIQTYVLDHSDSGGHKSRLIAELGAQHFDTRETSLSAIAAKVGQVDLVLEATGYAPILFEAAPNLTLNGVVCLLGVSGGRGDVTLESVAFNNNLVLGNRLIFGSVNASFEDFQSGVGHLQEISQRWPGVLEAMLTRRTALSHFQEAFHRQPEDIKVVIEIDS